MPTEKGKKVLTMDEYIKREDLLELYRMDNPVLNENGHVPLPVIRQNIMDIPAADVASVRHGRWMHTKKHLWYKNKDGSIDEWRLDVGFHNGPECQVCGEAVCMHCHPDWESMECEIGHYICSVCGEVSIDAHENYCPNCGAKMDGGVDNETS